MINRVDNVTQKGIKHTRQASVRFAKDHLSHSMGGDSAILDSFINSASLRTELVNIHEKDEDITVRFHLTSLILVQF